MAVPCLREPIGRINREARRAQTDSSFSSQYLTFWQDLVAVAKAGVRPGSPLNAESEYEAFRREKTAIPDEHMSFSDAARTLLDVSDHFIAGEIALQKADWETAAEWLKQAIEIEDSLTYGEPPQYLQPVRHTLGAVYLKARRFEDAERTYREDLKKWPHNGWSLFGLSRALQQQGKSNEANDVRKEYERAWSRADAAIDTSCKCLPKT